MRFKRMIRIYAVYGVKITLYHHSYTVNLANFFFCRDANRTRTRTHDISKFYFEHIAKTFASFLKSTSTGTGMVVLSKVRRTPIVHKIHCTYFKSFHFKSLI